MCDRRTAVIGQTNPARCRSGQRHRGCEAVEDLDSDGPGQLGRIRHTAGMTRRATEPVNGQSARPPVPTLHQEVAHTHNKAASQADHLSFGKAYNRVGPWAHEAKYAS